MKQKNKSWFTLVELIVVITILAILWTIAFISLQWYSRTARDSIRVTDIKNIKTSLEIFSLWWWKYPIADNAQDVTYSGWTVVLWKQWTIWTNVTKNLSRQLSEKPADPLYETEYIYSTLENGEKYEVLSTYEEVAYNNAILWTSYAEQPSLVKIEWTYNRLFIKKWSLIVPSPSIITSLDPAWLELDITTIKSQVVNRVVLMNYILLSILKFHNPAANKIVKSFTNGIWFLNLSTKHL